MTQDEIIEMAKQAGIEEAYSLKHNQYLVRFKDGSLEVFAKLVAEAEREACAKVCDRATLRFHLLWGKFEYPEDQAMSIGASQCAAAIRERGQA